MTDTQQWYSDDKVYRTGSEPTLEVLRDGESLVISIDSWDAPEAAIRLRAEHARGLRDFLLAPASLKGFAIHLGREEWGVIIDALVQHRGHADARKAANSESTSDVRADMCADLIARLGAAAALPKPEASEERARIEADQ